MGKFNNKISAEYNPPRKWILERALSYTNPDIDEDALERVGVKVRVLRSFVQRILRQTLHLFLEYAGHLLHLGMLLVLQLFTIFFINVFVSIVVLEAKIRK